MNEENEQRALLDRRAEEVARPCVVSSEFEGERPRRATDAQLELDFDLPATTPGTTAKRLSTVLLTGIRRAVPEYFEDDPNEPSKACASCLLTHAREGIYSWRCTVDHLPTGAYPAYEIAGLSIDDTEQRARPLDLQSICRGKREAVLVRHALRLLRESGNGQVAQEIAATVRTSEVSFFRSKKDVVLSFTKALPHGMKGVGTVSVPLADVQRICGGNKLFRAP